MFPAGNTAGGESETAYPRRADKRWLPAPRSRLKLKIDGGVTRFCPDLMPPPPVSFSDLERTGSRAIPDDLKIIRVPRKEKKCNPVIHANIQSNSPPDVFSGNIALRFRAPGARQVVNFPSSSTSGSSSMATCATKAKTGPKHDEQRARQVDEQRGAMPV